MPLLMHCMPLPNRSQTIPHQELIIPRREQRRWHTGQNRNPAVVHIAECFAAEEYSCHDSRTKVTSEVRGDGVIAKAPNHGSECKTNREGRAGRGDEGIRRIETGPDYDADVGVDEEFGHEKETEISGGSSVSEALLCVAIAME